jgi:hypothetical protein
MRPDIFLATIGRGSNGSNALEVTEDRAAVTAESQDNIINRVNNVSQYGPSWHYVPGIGVAGTAYAEVPGSATGDLAFSRASSKTRTNAAGLIQTIGNNVPPHDYRNADGTLSTFPRLNLEPQRTNVTLQSETITAGTGTTVTLDTTSAPTGLNTADKLVEDTSTGLHFTAFGGALGGTLDSSVYCVIIFAKAAGRTRFTMFDNGQVSAGASTFDLSNGTVISGTGRIENYGSGWYRCTIFPAKSTSTTANVQIRIVDTGTNTSYTGNGTSGLFLWGKQIEPNATYPTTYIPTTTAAVTRLQDTAIKTGVSSLIGQAEGTIFFEADIQKRNASEFYFGISVGSALGNALYVQQPTSGNLQILIRKTGNADGAITVLNANWTAGFNKVAVAYTSTTAEVFINGVSRGTTSFLSAPACNQITVGSRIDVPGTLVGAGGYAQAALFIRRLTNAELAAITTL